MKKYAFRAEYLLIILLLVATIIENITWKHIAIPADLNHNYGVDSKRIIYWVAVYIMTVAAYIVHVMLRNHNTGTAIIKYIHVAVSGILLILIGINGYGVEAAPMTVISLQMDMFLYAMLFVGVQILWTCYGLSKMFIATV